MSVPTRVGPVVVGVPDEPSDELLRVAVEQARARGVGIGLVRVRRKDRDRQLLATTANRLRALAPDVAVSPEFVAGDVFPELLERTRGATLLVLGGDALADESVSAWYVGRSSCPVVVVTPEGRLLSRSKRSLT